MLTFGGGTLTLCIFINIRHSYDYGMVHFIMMSTEHDFSPNSRQYNWLENDLKNVDRKKTPWVVIGGHRSMYMSEAYMSKFKEMSL